VPACDAEIIERICREIEHRLPAPSPPREALTAVVGRLAAASLGVPRPYSPGRRLAQLWANLDQLRPAVRRRVLDYTVEQVVRGLPAADDRPQPPVSAAQDAEPPAPERPSPPAAAEPAAQALDEPVTGMDDAVPAATRPLKAADPDATGNLFGPPRPDWFDRLLDFVGRLLLGRG